MNKKSEIPDGSGNEKDLRQAELDLILKQTEALTPKELKQKNKEKEETIIELRNGTTTSIKEWKDYISEHRTPSEPHFGYEKTPYYKNIYHINKWPDSEYKKFVKREEVAIWTIRLIYGRFPDGVVQHVRKHNPILFAYIRRDKYYHYLNEEGQKMLDDFIADFNRMIVGYDDWDKFEKDYCDKYRISYQPKIDIPI